LATTYLSLDRETGDIPAARVATAEKCRLIRTVPL